MYTMTKVNVPEESFVREFYIKFQEIVPWGAYISLKRDIAKLEHKRPENIHFKKINWSDYNLTPPRGF